MDNLPPPIQVTRGDNSSKPPSDDDSLVEFKVKNPFQKFFDWIISFIKRNANITIKIPIIGLFVALSSFSIGLGSGYHWGVNTALSKVSPHSSPIFHRAITLEGTISKSDANKYYLKTEDHLWTLKAVKGSINLENYLNQKVQILGNLTKEVNLVEVSEVIPLETPTVTTVPTISIPSSPPNPSNPPDTNLPDLYPNLEWVTTQKRVLIFTSGKRKIEQEGTYLESAQIQIFPQDFINYYIGELKAQSFKETFNSINPEGITITYAKDDLFLTFGTQNKYSGSGDKKQLVGYTAFIEHN